MAETLLVNPKNATLVNNLRQAGLVVTDKVYNAMLSVDRGNYVNSSTAYDDCPQAIGYGATISAPHMHAQCLELLLPYILRPEARVLDVGSGSGYLVSCIAAIMKQSDNHGRVIGIDHIDELVESSHHNLNRDRPDLFDEGYAEIVVGDGYSGVPSMSPFDCIHVGAAAPQVPGALIEQLKVGGRMVIPVGPEGGKQWLMQIDKTHDGQLVQTQLEGVRYVPLTTVSRQLR